ncbi:MAG: hypothetical protein WDO74_07870 [Pseudomonadota bacterium]
MVSRAAGWVRVLCTASSWTKPAGGSALSSTRCASKTRVASAFAEAGECKLSCLSQYLGEGREQWLRPLQRVCQ